MEMKLTAGPKKAALEHMRKKIEIATERIRVAKLKEDQAKMAWEVAAKAVKDEEAIKQKLCEDLSNLVQESSNKQFARLEELKQRLEALNPNRSSTYPPSHVQDVNPTPALASITQDALADPSSSQPDGGPTRNLSNQGIAHISNGQNQQTSSDGEGRGKKKSVIQGRVKGIGAIPKGRGPATTPGWTGAGFDVDSRY